MEENWNTSIECFASTPIMAISESSVLPNRECFPISHPPPLQVPRFVTFGMTTKKRTPRVRVDQIQELGIKISTTETEKKKEKKVVKKLRKPLPFDLNLLPDINEGEKVSRKRKKPTNSELQGTDTKKSRNKSSAKFSFPNPAPSLPNYVKAVIEGGGALEGDPVLVIQRILNKTDLSFHHDRLGIPERQVLCPGFLTDDEMQILFNNEGIETDVIMPSLEKRDIVLRMWKMGTKNCRIFVFTGSWNKCRETERMRSKEHRLLLNTVLQVWAYRYHGNDTPRFALVNVGWHPCNAAAEAEIAATIAAADVAAAAAAAAAAANAPIAAANAAAWMKIDR